MSTASDRVTVKAGDGLTIPLGFPSGATLVPGGEAEIDGKDLDHPAVAGWKDDGLFSVPIVESAKDALVAEAKALGIPADGRWSVARLEAAIAQAKAAAAAAEVGDGGETPQSEEPAAETAETGAETTTTTEAS